jgi:hypothetical protein
MVMPPSSPECESLHEQLANEADQLPENMSRIHEDSVTRRESRTIAGAYGGRSPPATTLAVGSVVGGPPGAPSSMTAHSRKSVGEAQSRKHHAKGADAPGGSKAAGCGTGKPHQYRKGKSDHRHAEAKIIEDWSASGGQGQLILNVSRPVCENCAALIRHVNCPPPGGKPCNKVVVCGDNQSPEATDRLKC